MSQRAASNAYSWWRESHFRTKQSKWLDVNLQEMEERVKTMLKLIEEDADSFAKRAEMYFKRRPELISVVEESYREYRALADRYDHISGELHKANHFIAIAFPDQVQYSTLDEEDDNFPKAITPIDPGKLNKPVVEVLVNKEKENQSSVSKAQKKKNIGKIDKEKAQEEINKLQKGILVLQEEKEFIKSSYESGMAKYREIEKKIMEMEKEVFFLEDEFSVSAVIGDANVRALMTTTALQSCEDTIVRLQEQRGMSMKIAKAESERIKVAVEKLRALKGESNVETAAVSNENSKVITFLDDIEEEAYSLNKEKDQLHIICEKVKEHIQTNPESSALGIEKDITELVNIIIDLDLTISSQTAQIDILSSENNEMEKRLQSIEENTILADDAVELTKRLREAEDELNKVQIIEKNIHNGEKDFQTNFTELFNRLNDISEKMESPKHHKNAQMINPFLDEGDSSFIPEPQRNSEVKEIIEFHDITEDLVEEIHVIDEVSHCLEDHSRSEVIVLAESKPCKMQETSYEFESKDRDSIHAILSTEKSCNQETQSSEKDIIDLEQLLLNCPEGGEKNLLNEYTSILRNYSETKKTLSEVENNNENNLQEMTSIIKGLKNVNAMKDDEIRILRQELSFLKATTNLNVNAAFSQGKDSGRGHRKFRSMPNFPTVPDNKNVSFLKMPPKPKLKPIATRNKSVGAIDIGTSLTEGTNLQCNDERDDALLFVHKFRGDIDALLEENLEFWLRFSTSFHQVQEFQTKFDNIKADINKVKATIMQEGGTSSSNDLVSKAKLAPAAAQLRALKAEFEIWLEQSQLLRKELEARFSSLCNIQEEISGVVNADDGKPEAKLTRYQAAKFQGEVLDMQQENNKVATELQVGQDHVRGLQTEIEREFSKLYNVSEPSSMPKTSNNPTKYRVPLWAFLFGARSKKPSIFACVNPVSLKQHSNSRSQDFH